MKEILYLLLGTFLTYGLWVGYDIHLEKKRQNIHKTFIQQIFVPQFNKKS